jgi:hypothetical protein
MFSWRSSLGERTLASFCFSRCLLRLDVGCKKLATISGNRLLSNGLAMMKK